MDISWSNARECLVGFQILWSCRRRSQERMRTGGHLLPFHIGAAGCFICHCVPWTSEGGQVLSGPKRRPLKSPKVCMGSLTFSCSCRAYPYVQFYTECAPMCFDLFHIAVAGLRFYGGNLALHHEFDVGTIITGTGWVHSADLTGVDTFHCQS